MDLQVDWTPGIGDPTFMGWFTVVAYFAAAWLCVAARRALREHVSQPELGRQPQVWSAAAVFMVLLGINKELDLQTFFTALGRAVLTNHGWMPIHREIQLVFISSFVTAAMSVLVFACWLVRHRRREYWLLMLGVTVTTTFIVVRASSFHNFDHFIGTYVIGVKMNWALELSGIALTALAARSRIRHSRSPERR